MVPSISVWVIWSGWTISVCREAVITSFWMVWPSSTRGIVALTGASRVTVSSSWIRKPPSSLGNIGGGSVVMGGEGLLRNSSMGFGFPVLREGSEGRCRVFLEAGGGLLMGLVEVRFGVNLLEARKLLSVEGLLNPRPRMFPRGTVARVLEEERGLVGSEVRLVDRLADLDGGGGAGFSSLGGVAGGVPRPLPREFVSVNWEPRSSRTGEGAAGLLVPGLLLGLLAGLVGLLTPLDRARVSLPRNLGVDEDFGGGSGNESLDRLVREPLSRRLRSPNPPPLV